MLPTDCLHVPLTIQRRVLAVAARRIEFRLRALTHTVLSYKMMTPRIGHMMHSDLAYCGKIILRKADASPDAPTSRCYGRRAATPEGWDRRRESGRKGLSDGGWRRRYWGRGQNLTDQAGEFVAVPGEPGGYGDRGNVSGGREHEMHVRGVGVDASSCAEALAVPGTCSAR